MHFDMSNKLQLCSSRATRFLNTNLLHQCCSSISASAQHSPTHTPPRSAHESPTHQRALRFSNTMVQHMLTFNFVNNVLINASE